MKKSAVNKDKGGGSVAKKRSIKSSSGKKKARKYILVFFLMLAGGLIWMFADVYNKVMAPNISLKERKTTYIHIPTKATYADVINILADSNILVNRMSFEWMASLLEYPKHVHPGRYLIHNKMNNRDLVRLLRSGTQTPVKFVLNNIRTKSELAGRVSRSLEADSISVLDFLEDSVFLSGFKVNRENALSLFIPNTYEFYWNTSAEEFINRMATEHDKFWNESRKKRARRLDLSPAEVSSLASIVEKETSRNDEKGVIAGVYINRLRKGWKLEADPTLVYALGDFTIKRVLHAYKKIESPYNTYMYEGLPPGPICLPSIASLDAVLNFQQHNYMYFCAKEDFSGYHNFASSYDQHLINARKFQRELKRKNIMF